jgi:hypothetical protein
MPVANFVEHSLTIRNRLMIHAWLRGRNESGIDRVICTETESRRTVAVER